MSKLLDRASITHDKNFSLDYESAGRSPYDTNILTKTQFGHSINQLPNVLPTVDSINSLASGLNYHQMHATRRTTKTIPQRSDLSYSQYQSQASSAVPIAYRRSKSNGSSMNRKVAKLTWDKVEAIPVFDETKYPSWLFEKKENPMLKLLLQADQ